MKNPTFRVHRTANFPEPNRIASLWALCKEKNTFAVEKKIHFDVHHEKTLALSYPKKDWRAGAPPILWVWQRQRSYGLFSRDAGQLPDACIVTNEPCHTRAGLKIFVGVRSKEGLGSTCPVKPSFSMTPTTQNCTLLCLLSCTLLSSWREIQRLVFAWHSSNIKSFYTFRWSDKEEPGSFWDSVISDSCFIHHVRCSVHQQRGSRFVTVDEFSKPS